MKQRTTKGMLDEAGNWSARKDVRNVRVMAGGRRNRISMQVFNNEWLTIKGKIGPEVGIGHYLGDATAAPVMLVKSCNGNRSLGWDLLPPGSEPYEYDGSEKVLEAQLAVDGTTGKYPEFKGNVATVFSHPLSMGGTGAGHYDGNPETYMNVGEAMGKAMAGLLKN